MEYPNSTLSRQFQNKSQVVPIAITDHSLSKIFRKHLHLLYMNQEMKNRFTIGLINSFCGAKTK